MKPLLAVARLTDAFGALWSELATTAGVEVQVWDGSSTGLPAGSGLCGVVVAAGGAERSALELVGELRTLGVPVAVAGSERDYRVATALMRAGASDYFALLEDVGRLRSWVIERVEAWTGVQRGGALAAGHRQSYDFSRILGRSRGMEEALARATRVIPRAATTVLLLGEAGTGKELFAQTIHYNGPRAGEPFVTLNCTALPAALLDGELFGYERGAVAEAPAGKPGLLEAAGRGTLFLDEVSDLGPETQARLLKVLEDRQVRRLGSVRERQVDVRVIAATRADLEAEVRAGRFRQDLYYRLGVVPIPLPALRERGEDVLLLARHFLERFSREFATACPEIGPALRREMLAYAWPGNVRELRNSMERAVVLGGGTLRREDVFLAESARPRGTADLPFPARLAEIERAAARAMVQAHAGNKSAAAEALGISRKYLYALLNDKAGDP